MKIFNPFYKIVPMIQIEYFYASLESNRKIIEIHISKTLRNAAIFFFKINRKYFLTLK